MTLSPEVLIKDTTHDPFIIFGGLFSRSLINFYLHNTQSEDLKCIDDADFQKALEYKKIITSQIISEERLRKLMAQHLLSGVMSSLPPSSRGDIFYDDVVIEVKNELLEFDLEKIKGSIKNEKFKRQETAVEELFRYLGAGEKYKWGVLTTGRIFRFYNVFCNDQYVEIDLFDILDSGDLNYFSVFKNLLTNKILRESLKDKTFHIRNIQAKDNLLAQLNMFLNKSEKEDREKAHSKVVLFFTFISLKYLEDIGVLPILNHEYQAYSLREMSIGTKEKLKQTLDSFLSGKWFNGVSQKALLSDSEYQLICENLKDDLTVSRLKKSFAKFKDFDYSDIVLDQLGGVYQDLVNKNSEGAYYTPYIIGKKISGYLKSLSETKKINFEGDSNKVIVDIACGSGQLLRALVPSSHLFFKNQEGLLGKNSLRRNFISRLVGVDKDPNSVFLCRLSLSLFAAEYALGLSFPRLVKEEDTLQAFCNSRSNFIEIPREDIFSIVTNPPWESLEFNESNIYRRETGAKLPNKSNASEEAEQQKKEFDKWLKQNAAVVKKERARIDEIKKLCDLVELEHKEYFEGKKNTALHFMFIVHKIVEASNGSYVVVLPDRFFLGETTPLRDKISHEFDAYMPFQNCGSIFDGVDKGTRFGILFGRKKEASTKANITIQIPVIENDFPIDFKTCKVNKADLEYVEENLKHFMMPFYKNQDEIDLLIKWFGIRHRVDSWRQGSINLGGKNKSEDLQSILKNNGSAKYKIVKSANRKKSGTQEYMGVLDTPFGASLTSLPENQIETYKATKIIMPNVKRNGVRKLLCSCEKDCLVEHGYNYNEDLTENDQTWLRSLTVNSIVNILAGSYNVNASTMNLVGTVSSLKKSDDYFVDEVNLLKKMGFSINEALSLIFNVLLDGFPEDFILSAYDNLFMAYTQAMRSIDLSHFEFIEAAKKQKNIFIKQTKELDIDNCKTLASTILKSFADDPNFGRVKFAKILYLSEHILEVNTGFDWKREAAGPYNKKDMMKLEDVLKEELKIEIKEQPLDGKKMVRYKAKDKKILSQKNLTGSNKKKFEEMVKKLRTLNTERMESIATLYAVWNDLLMQGKDDNDSFIVEEFRENWAPSKLRFSEDRLLNDLRWMRENGFIPEGKGYRTAA